MASIINKVASKFTKSKTARKTVLITGISGFIATQVAQEFLSNGYTVLGTVRSEATAEKVRKNFPDHGDQLAFAIVPDVAAPGAHDEAVKDVDGVIHLASPFQLEVSNNEDDLLKPAMNGTKGILESVHNYNPDIKRVVITSSFAAMIDMSKGNWAEHSYTENDWNPVTYEEAKSGNGAVAYCASKTFAEKIAWDFVKEHKPNFSVSTINPPMVYGPALHNPDLNKLNTSSADIYRLMNASEREVPDDQFQAWVDVRDVAKAHRVAYEKKEAGAQRFFTTAGNFHYQDACDVLRKIPELKDRVPEGTPGSSAKAPVYKVDNSKARKELGIDFIPLEKSITDMAKQFLESEKASQK